jgi:predicted ATP-grasp superfamily ATP-dependent carboligase
MLYPIGLPPEFEGNRLKRSSESLSVVVSPVFVNGTALLQAFGRRGAYCVAVSSDPDAPGFHSRFAREKVLLGAPPAPSFADWLLSRRDLYGAIVVPTGDEAVAELDARRGELSPHFRLCLPPPFACQVALDKSRLASLCAENAIPAPRTVAAPLDLDSSDLDAAAGLGFPALVKPCMSDDFQRAFTVKAFPVASPAQLRDALALCRSRSLPVVLQELIPGNASASYSAYVARDGRIAGGYSSRRIALSPPDMGIGYFEVSEFIEPVLDAAQRLIKAVGYAGAPVNIDFKLDPRDGAWKLLDLNARSWRQVTLAPLVGVPVFDMLLADYAGRGVPDAGRIRYGRHWLYLKDALLVSRAYPGNGPRFADLVKMLSTRFTLGLWDFADIKPFLADIAPLVLRRFRKKGLPSDPPRA